MAAPSRRRHVGRRLGAPCGRPMEQDPRVHAVRDEAGGDSVYQRESLGGYPGCRFPCRSQPRLATRMLATTPLPALRRGGAAPPPSCHVLRFHQPLQAGRPLRPDTQSAARAIVAATPTPWDTTDQRSRPRRRCPSTPCCAPARPGSSPRPRPHRLSPPRPLWLPRGHRELSPYIRVVLQRLLAPRHLPPPSFFRLRARQYIPSASSALRLSRRTSAPALSLASPFRCPRAQNPAPQVATDPAPLSSFR